ncbi:NAD(P)/FAD-dependent oxidoreductase [uncultured Chitinophaga sp.]|uniref:phytoene desaturase family protein n=1 Tax=uncultured Chitinophaga sp. TaxID=339340 RepID=UPI0025F28FAF|nr:phytoene desaturase family protein [uncultured Chitinophaga sp.]
MQKENIIIIGSGFAGLSAACFLARSGASVTVLEQHHQPGGRARRLEEEGFRFDMGPSWYWMPDVFDRFFAAFGKKTSDYYALERLSPSYDIYWADGPVSVPADYAGLRNLFESLEKGSAAKLDAYLEGAAFKYKTGMQQLAYKPGRSLLEFADMGMLKAMLGMDMFSSMKSHIGKYFQHPRLRQLLEFPILFLGALAEHIPALYSFMNYADIQLGTWYPKGGMYSVVEAMYTLALELGVDFRFSEQVKAIEMENNGRAGKVRTAANCYNADVIVGAADYHFIETQLLPEAARSYSTLYWERRVMAPSCLIYYVGINKKLKNVRHHSLFFDVPFDAHAAEIYTQPQWPTDPLFYLSITSQTDNTVAPPGHENLFLLIPVAAGLTGDDEALRKRYFDKVIGRLEQQLGEPIAPHIVYYKSYAGSNFMQDYNAFKGNAYGLANTIRQTALLKPSMHSRKVPNLFYTGQLTVPGPGVPPAIISGEIVAAEVQKYLSRKPIAQRKATV